MSASASRVIGSNVANKVAGNSIRAKAAVHPPTKTEKAASKAVSAKPSPKSPASKKTPKTATSSKKIDTANRQTLPEDVIENAPRSLVISLYKQLLRKSRSLQYTDKDFFARRMHQEFMKRKDVKDNNLYYIRGKWMLENNMGGLL